MNHVKTKLSKMFKMRDLGPASFILGIEIRRDRTKRKIALSQEQYVKTVLERCGMSESKPAYTPMAHNVKLTADDPEDDATTFEMTVFALAILL